MKLSLDQIRDKIYAKITPPPQTGPHVWVCDIYMDHAIISRDGKYYKLPFSIKDGELEFGDEVEVQKDWVPAAKVTSGIRLKAASGDKTSEDYGYKWDVQVWRFG